MYCPSRIGGVTSIKQINGPQLSPTFCFYQTCTSSPWCDFMTTVCFLWRARVFNYGPLGYCIKSFAKHLIFAF